MPGRGRRIIGGAVVAGLAIAALRLPSPEAGNPGDLLSGLGEGGPLSATWTAHDTLGFGETLSGLLTRRGLSPSEAYNVIQAATPLNPRRIPAGMPIELRGDTSDTRPQEIRFRLAADRILHVARAGNAWAAAEETLPWSIDTLVVRGTVREHLYQAVGDGSDGLLVGRSREELAWAIADIYEYKIDMSRELQQGDQVRAVFERQTLPDGTQKIGTVIAAGLQRAGTEIQAYRFVESDGRVKYYDEQGRSLAGAFLRAPLSFRRISSNFGRRRHPILGTFRNHSGLDYAANAGTPVRALGDGVVTFAGVRGGYGNLLEIRHRNGMVTRYAHLRGFARGVRRGRSVTIGETVAFVGSTGLSTAPHLHFEVLIGGSHRDPRRALAQVEQGPPLRGGELERFELIRDGVMFALEQPAGPLRALGN